MQPAGACRRTFLAGGGGGEGDEKDAQTPQIAVDIKHCLSVVFERSAGGEQVKRPVLYVA